MRKVQRTRELQRIVDLPTRDGAVPYAGPRLSTDDCPMELWPQQEQALAEIHEMGGGIINLAAGEGKSLVSLLAFHILGARRPLLVVPASLRIQTKEAVIPFLSQCGWIFPVPEVRGYSEFSLKKNHSLLNELRPDVIVLDEAHRLARTKSGRTRRFRRYLRHNADTKVVALSGTLMRRSLRDMAHIFAWALREYSPLPDPDFCWSDLEDLADCIDLKVRADARCAPGYLNKLADGKTARVWMGDRIKTTPGIVTSSGALGRPECSLIVNRKNGPLLNKRTKKLVQDAIIEWHDPQGDIIPDGMSLWRLLRQLQCGFYLRWKVKPPREWTDRRREWNGFVRESIANSRGKLDTEAQVKEAYPDAAELLQWQAIEPTFEPETEPVWVDAGPLAHMISWAQGNKGIVWVENRALGARLQNEGIPYYGAGSDRALMECTGGPVALSIAAHGEGKNLQDRWSTNLFPVIPSSAATFEQTIARTHRAGQPEDEVTADVWLSIKQSGTQFEALMAEAIATKQIMGIAQRLTYCTIL